MNKHIYNKKIIIILTILIGIYIIISYSISLWKYNTLRSNWPFDLAFHNHVYWNFIKGNYKITLTPSKGANGPFLFKQDHFSLIRFILVPFYLLFPKLETLLFLYVLIISLGIIPTYLIVRSITDSDLLGLFSCLFYIFIPPIFNLSIYDFEPLPLCIPFLLFTFYFYNSQKLIKFIIFTIFTLAVREELMITIALLGIIGILKKEDLKNKMRWIIYPIILSLIWFILYLVYFYHFHRNLFWFRFLSEKFSASFSSLQNSIDSLKSAFIYLYKTWNLFLFLAFLTLLPLVIIIPNLLFFSTLKDEVFLSPYYPDLKYTAIINTFIFISFIISLSKLYNFSKHILLNFSKRISFAIINIILIILIFLLIIFWVNNLSIILQYKSGYTSQEIGEINKLANKIDDSVIVLTSYNLCPKFSSRKEIYCYEELEPYYSWDILKKVNYAIVEKRHKEVLDKIRDSDRFDIFLETENIVFFKNKF